MDNIEIKPIKSQQPKQNHQSSQNIIIEEKLTRPNGQNFVKKYQRGKVLGKGGFAKCYEVINLDNKKISAIKIVNKQTLKKPKAKQKLITEIKIHKFLNHKNVVQFDHVFEDSENVYILLQLCNYYTLNEMMKKRKRVSQLQVQYYISQIIQGVSYLHTCRVIHRDLKLGNLMIGQNMQVKIGDFGLAAKLEYSTQKKKTICGTPNYIAPQILQGRGHSYQVDIWSIGVIIYALLYGRPPFETNDVRKTYKKIKEANYAFNEQISVSNNAKNLISKILVSDPSKRPTLQQIMQHPFMSSNKIPKSLPVSALTSQLSKNYFDQHSCGTVSDKKFSSSKSVQRPQIQLEKAKSFKGISQRLLLKTSAGFTRNLLSKNQQRDSNSKKQQSAQKHNDPTVTFKQNNKPALLSNNYFNIVKQMESMNYMNGGYNSKSTSTMNKNKIRQSLSQTNTVFVKKWVDYSAKYGLGYLLSDGTTGIYFNDSSKIVVDSNNEKVDYISKGQYKKGDLLSFKMNQIPSNRQISKKVTLMQYFRKYLNGTVSFGGTTQSTIGSQKKLSDSLFCYVKRWLKTDQGILFRLNNKLIQVNFIDKSQLVIYGDKGILVYTSSNHTNKAFYQLSTNDIPKGSQTFKKMQIVKKMLIKLNNKDQEEGQIQNSSQQQLAVTVQ